MALQWFVVHAYSNFEHKVKSSLIDRVRRFGLEAKFGEILVPTEEVVEMREGQRRKSERNDCAAKGAEASSPVPFRPVTTP
jgi:transcriptional antiterminator NusG